MNFQTILKFKDNLSFLLADLLFPHYCLICKEGNKLICTSCLPSLTPPEQKCIYCKSPSLHGITHAKCFKKGRVSFCWSAFSYHDDVVKEIIINAKYHFSKYLFPILTEVAFRRINETPLLKNSTLVPIPLHPNREIWRGFNQAQLISQTLSILSDQSTQNLLIRTKDTKIQKDLESPLRPNNTKNAFQINPKATPPNQNTQIILVDDVITTGSTTLSASKALRQSGIKTTGIITLCCE